VYVCQSFRCIPCMFHLCRVESGLMRDQYGLQVRMTCMMAALNFGALMIDEFANSLSKRKLS